MPNSKRTKIAANATLTRKGQHGRKLHNCKLLLLLLSVFIRFSICIVNAENKEEKEGMGAGPAGHGQTGRQVQGPGDRAPCLTQRLGQGRTSPLGSRMNASQLSSAMKTRKSKSRVRLVTFREMRAIQRLMEAANVGPGSTEYLKPLGSDLPNVGFGKKHAFRPDANPGPGAYDVGKADKLTKSTSRAHSIRPRTKDVSGNATTATDAGRYNPHKDFGSDLKKMTIGRRRERAESNTPPPGAYNTETGLSMTKPKSTTALIRRKSTSAARREAPQSPDPGAYYDASK